MTFLSKNFRCIVKCLAKTNKTPMSLFKMMIIKIMLNFVNYISHYIAPGNGKPIQYV